MNIYNQLRKMGECGNNCVEKVDSKLNYNNRKEKTTQVNTHLIRQSKHLSTVAPIQLIHPHSSAVVTNIRIISATGIAIVDLERVAHGGAEGDQ